MEEDEEWDEETAGIPDPVHRKADQLSQNELSVELEQRGLKPTGFWSDDAKKLQVEFDKEFEVERSEVESKREKARAAREREWQEQLRIQAEEQALREEEEAVAEDAKVSFWIDLIEKNKTPQAATLVLNDVLARAVSKVIKINQSLVSLDLSRNQLTDNSGVFLAKMVEGNSCLVKLELEANHLGPLTARAMGEALITNETLTFMNMEGNPLTGDFAQQHGNVKGHTDYSGVQNLGESLAQNQSLTYLNLRRTGLGHQGGSAIAKALQTNKKLVYLDVGSNSLGANELEDIANYIDRNNGLLEQKEGVAREQRAQQFRADRERERIQDMERKQKEEDDWMEEQRQLRIANRIAKIEAERKAKEDELARIAAEEERKRKEEEAAASKKKGKKKKKKK